MGNGIEITELKTSSDKLREAKNLILEVLHETRHAPVFSEMEIADLQRAAKTLIVIAGRMNE